MENREILFRGIRKDDREWVEGVPIESNMNGEGYETFMYVDYTVPNAISLIVGKGHFGRCVEVIPETVGQFTGLFDKNGKKIFENDVVKHYIYPKNKYSEFAISFKNGRFCFDVESYHFGDNFGNILPSYDLEVIGTIHDHLLEANNE